MGKAEVITIKALHEATFHPGIETVAASGYFKHSGVGCDKSVRRTIGRIGVPSTLECAPGHFCSILQHKGVTGWFRIKSPIQNSPYAGARFITEQTRRLPYVGRRERDCEFTPKSGCMLSRERVEKIIGASIKQIPLPKLLRSDVI